MKTLALLSFPLLALAGCRTAPIFESAKRLICGPDGTHERADKLLDQVSEPFGLPGVAAAGVVKLGLHFICGTLQVGLEAAKVAASTAVDRPSELIGLVKPSGGTPEK